MGEQNEAPSVSTRMKSKCQAPRLARRLSFKSNSTFLSLAWSSLRNKTVDVMKQSRGEACPLAGREDQVGSKGFLGKRLREIYRWLGSSGHCSYSRQERSRVQKSHASKEGQETLARAVPRKCRVREQTWFTPKTKSSPPAFQSLLRLNREKGNGLEGPWCGHVTARAREGLTDVTFNL